MKDELVQVRVQGADFGGVVKNKLTLPHPVPVSQDISKLEPLSLFPVTSRKPSGLLDRSSVRIARSLSKNPVVFLSRRGQG